MEMSVVHNSMAHNPMAHNPMAHNPMAHNPMAHNPMAHNHMAHNPMAHNPMAHNPMDSNVDKESHDTFMTLQTGEEYRHFLYHAIRENRGIPGYGFDTAPEDEHSWVTSTRAGELLQQILARGLITWNAQECGFPDELFPPRSTEDIEDGLLGANCRAHLFLSAEKRIALDFLTLLHQRGLRAVILHSSAGPNNFTALGSTQNEYDDPDVQKIRYTSFDSSTELPPEFLGFEIPRNLYVLINMDCTRDVEENRELSENLRKNWINLLVIDPLFNRPMSYKSGLLSQLNEIMILINGDF